MIELTSLLFDRIFSSLKRFKFIPWKKNTRHSHYVRFQLLLFSHVVAQKALWWSSKFIGELQLHAINLLNQQISLMSLDCEAKLKFFAESNMSIKIPHFRNFSASIISPFVPHSFPMHPFSIPWKYQKTVRFSDVFRG